MQAAYNLKLIGYRLGQITCYKFIKWELLLLFVLKVLETD